MTDKWYLAGPFFNPVQFRLINDIEWIFKDNGVGLFSPRLCDANKKKGPITDADADTIFSRNVENILECKAMLAVLDWKLPVGHELCVIKDPAYCSVSELQDERPYWRMSGGRWIQGMLNLPDTGTVFEMGAMYMQWLLLHQMGASQFPSQGGKPRLVIFTERKPEEKINLMLTKAGYGVLSGLTELNEFLNKGDIQWHLAKPWSGKNL